MGELDLKLQEALRAESLDDIGKNGKAMLDASVADWAFEANLMQLMSPGQRLDPPHFYGSASLLFMAVTLWGSRETHILAIGPVPLAARKAVRPQACKAVRPAWHMHAARNAVRIMAPRAVKLLKQRRQQEASGAAGSSAAAEREVGVTEVSC